METRKLLKIASIGLAVLLYLFLLLVSIFHVPLSLFLRMLPPIVVTLLLLRHTPIWAKGVIGVLLVMVGVYVLFNNDIIGPMEFAIRDMPFDMPAQFYHSWRYFWWMAYLYEVSWAWGFLSCLLLVIYKFWHYIQLSIETKNDSLHKCEK